MKFVILGCGRVGAMLAQLLVAESHDVTVIDQSSEAFSRLSQDFPQEKTVLG
ncbi:MAG: NAD-binding protein, partial [Ktedonobacterales bacterium]